MAPLNRSPSSSKLPFLQHFTHPKHPLHPVDLQREFLCNGCKELGSGLSYHCAACNFVLHDVCATSPATVASPFHPQHPLTLVNRPVNDRSCDLCGDLVHGLFYTCAACEFDVHPLCTQLPVHVHLPAHPHLLKLQQHAAPAGCAFCFKACTSWRYRCDACFVDVHVECVLGGGPEVSRTPATAAVGMNKAVFPPPPQQQQVGYGGCAYGIPVGGSGGGYYGMPSPELSKVEGKKRGSKKKKIYAIVGRLAATAVVTSLIGIPLGI